MIQQLLGQNPFSAEEEVRLPDEAARHRKQARKQTLTSPSIHAILIVVLHMAFWTVMAWEYSPTIRGVLLCLTSLAVMAMCFIGYGAYRHLCKTARREEMIEVAKEKSEEMAARHKWLQSNIRLVVKINPSHRQIIYELQDIRSIQKVYRCYVAEADGGDMEFDEEMLNDPKKVNAFQLFKLYEVPSQRPLRASKSKWMALDMDVPPTTVSAALNKCQEAFLANLPQTYTNEKLTTETGA